MGSLVNGERASGSRNGGHSAPTTVAFVAVVTLTVSALISCTQLASGSHLATGGSPSSSTIQPVSARPTNSGAPNVTQAYPTFGLGWPLSAPCATAQRQGVCLFAPDGSLYIATTGASPLLYSYDSLGHLRSGWPIEVPNGANNVSAAGYAVAPDGSLLVATATTLTDLDANAKARPGWPLTVANGNKQITVQHSGRVALTVSDPADDQTWVYDLDVQSENPLLWSTKVMHNGTSSTLAAPDGTLFMLSIPDASGSFAVAALGADGRQTMDWSDTRWDTAAVTANSHLALVAYDAGSTTKGGPAAQVLQSDVSMFDGNGGALSGWPTIVPGAVSAPVAGIGDSLYFIVANTDGGSSVLALGTGGYVKSGWSTRLASGYGGLPSVPPVPAYAGIPSPPMVANGLVYAPIASSTTSAQGISAFTASTGRLAWTYQLSGGSAFVDPGYVPAAVASPRGTLYVLEGLQASGKGAVAALDANGQQTGNWPYSLPAAPLGIVVLGNGGIGVWTMDYAARLTATGDLVNG